MENVLEHQTVSYGSLAHWPLKASTEPFTVNKAAIGNVGSAAWNGTWAYLPSSTSWPLLTCDIHHLGWAESA